MLWKINPLRVSMGDWTYAADARGAIYRWPRDKQYEKDAERVPGQELPSRVKWTFLQTNNA